jgi:hypothetical protein
LANRADPKLALSIVNALVRLWGSGTQQDIVAIVGPDYPQFVRNPTLALSEMSRQGLVGFQRVSVPGPYRTEKVVFNLIATREEAEKILDKKLADYIDNETVFRLSSRSKRLDPRRR